MYRQHLRKTFGIINNYPAGIYGIQGEGVGGGEEWVNFNVLHYFSSFGWISDGMRPFEDANSQQ